MIISEKEYLEHHGIKGQKWGVRRGPPYPIGSGDKKSKASKAQKGLARTRSAGWFNSNFAGKRFTLTNLDELDRGGDHNGSNQSIVNDLLAVNQWMRDAIEAGDTQADPYMSNCVNCATAFEMRRRGYDVQAKPTPAGRKLKELNSMLGLDVDNEGFTMNLGNPDTGSAIGAFRAFNDTLNEIDRQYPDGNRGFVNLRWSGSNAGHIVNWERMSDGDIALIDAQSGDAWTRNPSEFPSMFRNVNPQGGITFYRTDDHELRNEAASAVFNDSTPYTPWMYES